MLRRRLLLTTTAPVLGALAPQTARAAEYTVTTCAGQPAGLGGWAVFTQGAHRAVTGDAC